MSEIPAEAYGRVSRDVDALFGPVCRAADQHVERLRHDFDVALTPLASGAAGFRHDDTVRAVLVSPSDPRASSLTIGWTGFPGVLLRYGRFQVTALPSCGCDACDETTEECLEDLAQRLDLVTAGFWEELVVGAEVVERCQEPGGWSASTVLEPDRAAALRAGGPLRFDWAPWPARRAA